MKKKPNYFKGILIIFFIIYLSLFIANKTGYYKNTIRQDTLYTEKQIKKFEEDVKNNEVLDVINYLPEKPDYSNKITKGANAISNKLSKLLSNKSKNILEFLKTLFIG